MDGNGKKTLLYLKNAFKGKLMTKFPPITCLEAYDVEAYDWCVGGNVISSHGE